MFLLPRVWVQSPVGELKSHKPLGATQNKRKQNSELSTSHQHCPGNAGPRSSAEVGTAAWKAVSPLKTPSFILQVIAAVVQLLSHVQLFTTRQASLSVTISRSLLKLRSIESETPSNHRILCRPLLLLPSIFPSIRVFSNSWLFGSGGQNIGASISSSVLQMNIQDWFPLGLTGLISL